MYTVGLKGTGCDIELRVIRQTPKAYLVEDDEGNRMWLPKEGFDYYDELNEYGMRVYEEVTEWTH